MGCSGFRVSRVSGGLEDYKIVRGLQKALGHAASAPVGSIISRSYFRARSLDFALGAEILGLWGSEKRLN